MQRAESSANQPSKRIATGSSSLVDYRENPRIVAERYLLPAHLRAEHGQPTSKDIDALEKARKFRPGATVALTYIDGKPYMVPPAHPAFHQREAIGQDDYAGGIFEGSSKVAMEEDGKITGANLILHGPRLARFERSARGRGMADRINFPEFSDGLVHLAAANGADVLVSQKGEIGRAYLRPSAKRTDGPMGVGYSPAHVVSVDAIEWNWPDYLDTEKALSIGLTTVVAPEMQRLQPLRGKFASSYAEAARWADAVRSMKADEGLIFGPYLYKNGRKTFINNNQSEEARRKMLEHGVLADGPGEEFTLLVGKNGRYELWCAPMDTGVLGGTVRDHVANHTAPAEGIKPRIRPYTLTDIQGLLEGGYDVTPLYMGNAVTVNPVGEILVCMDLDAGPIKRIQTPVSDMARNLSLRYAAETKGQITTTNPHLLTPVDVHAGSEMNELFREAYGDWITSESRADYLAPKKAA